MDMTQAAAVLAMTAQQLLPMELVTEASLSNAQAQAANAIAELALAPAAQTAAVTAATDPLNTQIATLQQQLTDAATAATAAQTAAVNAATASLHTQINTLNAQLAGSAGSYTVPVSGAAQLALDLAAQAAGVTDSTYLNTAVQSLLAQLITQHAPQGLGLALQRYPSLSTADQNTILGRVFGVE